MLIGAGLDQVWHHSRAHRLFANARWSGDAVGLVLADLIVARLLPADSALTIAVDDTLFKRSGKKVFGVAWHHDGAAKGPKPIGFGNCWLVAGIVVQLLAEESYLRWALAQEQAQPPETPAKVVDDEPTSSLLPWHRPAPHDNRDAEPDEPAAEPATDPTDEIPLDRPGSS